MLQSAFSRDMEREADEFSHENLPKFNISPAAFADAMTLLVNSHVSAHSDLDSDSNTSDAVDEIENSLNHWLKYLSTHPDTQERIDTARNIEGH